MEDGKAWAIVIVAVLIIGVAASASSGLLPFATVGYVKSVPVQVGYNAVSDYWVLSATISESQSFKMALTAGTEKSTGTLNEVAKATSEVSLTFQPLNPVSSAPLQVMDLVYLSKAGLYNIGWEEQKVPSFDVADASWLTQARYNLWLHKGSFQILEWPDIRISYKDPKVLNVPTGIPGEDLTVENLGMLPQGVEVPSGDLVVVYDGYMNKHIVNKADLLRLVDKWETALKNWAVNGLDPLKAYTWGDVWAWGERNGFKPADAFMEHVSTVEYEGGQLSLNKIRLNYSGIAWAGFITVMIPAELADTVTVILNMPKPVMVAVTPLPALDEGKSATLDVTVKNQGTQGTISVTATSTSYSVVPLTSTSVEMNEGQEQRFSFQVTALSVDRSTTGSVMFLAQGRGGSDSRTMTGTIRDVSGYTPPTPQPPGATPGEWWAGFTEWLSGLGNALAGPAMLLNLMAWGLILIIILIVAAIAVSILHRREE